ncbi:dihydrolipoyl dehydrogenase [Buchnera aphidicola]|uniref:dihydrolipoyl dehydrogenase n=1 Tax=Buchnera aphidicola TaxID=9 RepID=UPI003BEF0698
MNKDIHAQVVIIGAGPAGYSAAFRCADLGLDTVLIERYDKLGGVCLNVGCIPSKSLLHIAKVIKEAKDLSDIGVDFNNPLINIEKIRNWKNSIINKLTYGLSIMREKRKIRIIQGKAEFVTNNTIIINSLENNFIISFQYAIIATGSRARKISSVSDTDDRIWDSTDALLLKSIPSRFLIIGGGVIGLEMATIYSALGSKVDIVDRFGQFFPWIDKDIADTYIKAINKKFNLMLNTHIEIANITKKDILIKIFKENVEIDERSYDGLLIAIGRIPNIDFLGIEKIGIRLNNFGFIEVNNQLKTNISNIYAIGDVIGFPMLAHKGIHQGHIAAEIISGKKHYFEPKVIPSIAYTEPEIAWVGLNEIEAKKRNIDYEISIFPWNASGRALASNCSTGMTKLIFDKQSNQIIGGSIVGSNAGELIGEIGLAIEMGCDAEDIALTIHAHPTLYESIGLCAEVFQGTITDLINHKSIL